MHFFIHNPEGTRKLAAHVIKEYAARPRTRALCIALEGELGAGKTTFAQGAARALGITRPMPSPTFILMREVCLPKSYQGITTLYHFDWYRLHRAESITQLGWREILRDPAHIVIVEWADKFPALLPPGTVRVRLSHVRQGREMSIESHES